MIRPRPTVITVRVNPNVSPAVFAARMSWWLVKPMRLAQTNLREIDADLDVDRTFAALKTLTAGVDLAWTRTAGGIACTLPRLDLFETLVMEHTQ